MSNAYPLRIAGIGRYLPKWVVTNQELESRCGMPPGWSGERLGVLERRWADNETNSYMGALAAKEALEAAGIDLFDLDLIINAAMSFERKVPDGGPFVQKQLGLEDSGIPGLTLQAGCLSFLVALDISGSLVTTGRYRNILIVSSEVISTMLDQKYPEAYHLFGDGAAAVVVTPAPEGEKSCINNCLWESYGEGVSYMNSLYGLMAYKNNLNQAEDLALQIDWHSCGEFGTGYLEDLWGKLRGNQSMKDFQIIVSQQLGQVSFDKLGIPGERLIRISDRFGFCGAASYPMALYEAVTTGKLKRNDLFLMLGLGSGLSVGGLIMTY